jgi:hypothetical protein
MGEADPYRQLYLPLMLSMTLGQPGAYWDARYAEELARVNAARLHMEEASAQNIGAATAPIASKVVVQTALDELYAWYGLPATLISIAAVAQLPVGIFSPFRALSD